MTTFFPPLKAVSQSRFLIVGYGDELRGDDAAGPQIASQVASWHLPAIKTAAVHHLTRPLIEDIVLADYTLFVSTCMGKSATHTVQLDPVVAENKSTKPLLSEGYNYNPWALLDLAQQHYGRVPQAWLLQIPAKSFDFNHPLSMTARQGYDRALRIIEQFLRTYQLPAALNTTKEPVTTLQVA